MSSEPQEQQQQTGDEGKPLDELLKQLPVSEEAAPSTQTQEPPQGTSEGEHEVGTDKEKPAEPSEIVVQPPTTKEESSGDQPITTTTENTPSEPVSQPDTLPTVTVKEEDASPPSSPTRATSGSPPKSPMRSILKSPEKKTPLPLSTPLKKQVSWVVEVRDHSKDARALITDVEDCIELMKKGTHLIKIRGKGFVREFSYHPELASICWKSEKTGALRSVSLSSVNEIRKGKRTKAFQKSFTHEYADRHCFSIIHGVNHDSLDLVAFNDTDLNVWVTGLKYLLKKKADTVEAEGARDQWLRAKFVEACVGDVSTLGYEDVLRVLKSLHVASSDGIVKLKYGSFVARLRAKEEGSDSALIPPEAQKLNVDEFVRFYRYLCTRQELYFLFAKYATEHYLVPETLQAFYQFEQGLLSTTLDQCKDLIVKYESFSEESASNGKLSFEGFSGLMMGEFGLFNAAHNEVHQDMTLPLRAYYIAASHNTFLMKDQMKGDSSIEGYIHALEAGARFVEVDVWSGEGEDAEPIVYNGYTMTSKILFKDVVNTLDEYAFKHSKYPLVVSLEVHCDIPRQKKVAQYIQEIFGLKLYTKVEGRYDVSPQDLMGKIIIKGPKHNPEEDGEWTEGDVVEEDEAYVHEKRRKKKMERNQRRDRDRDENAEEEPDPIKKMKLCRELSDLVVVMEGEAFEDLHEAITMTRPSVMMSFDHAKLEKKFATESGDYAMLHSMQFGRVYPSGLFVNSENFNAVPFWAHGVQVASINYQTPDRWRQIYLSKFRENGNCGYSLKPAYLYEEDESGLLNYNEATLVGAMPKLVHVEVFTGFHLPIPASSITNDVVDPYVEVELIGVPKDSNKQQTRVIENNHINPYWNESFEFVVHLLDFAFLRFTVYDQDVSHSNFLGQYTLPLKSALTGYRVVHLEDEHGVRHEESTLLVRLSMTDHHVDKETPRDVARRLSRDASKRVRESAAHDPDDEDIDKGLLEIQGEIARLGVQFTTTLETCHKTFGSANLADVVGKLQEELKSKAPSCELALVPYDQLFKLAVKGGSMPDQFTAKLEKFNEVAVSAVAVMKGDASQSVKLLDLKKKIKNTEASRGASVRARKSSLQSPKMQKLFGISKELTQLTTLVEREMGPAKEAIFDLKRAHIKS